MLFDPFVVASSPEPQRLLTSAFENGPLSWGAASNPGGPGAWYTVGYELTKQALNDPRLGRETHRKGPGDVHPLLRGLWELVDRWVMFRDPPCHTRLRGPLEVLQRRAWWEQLLAATRSRVDRVAEQSLDGAEVDWVQEVADPVAFAALADVLGLDEADRAALRTLCPPFAALLDAKRSPEVYLTCATRCATVHDLIGRALDRAEQGLLHALRQSVRDGSLARDEAIANAFLVLVTGQETTRRLLANLAVCALRSPETVGALTATAAARRALVTETLRLESPVQMTGRVVREPFTLAGVALAPGDVVVCHVGAANRDPSVFAQPDRFRTDRRRRPLSYGGGAHACLGSHISPAIAEIVCGLLTHLLATYRLAAPMRWTDTALFRSPDRLLLAAAA